MTLYNKSFYFELNYIYPTSQIYLTNSRVRTLLLQIAKTHPDQLSSRADLLLHHPPIPLPSTFPIEQFTQILSPKISPQNRDFKTFNPKHTSTESKRPTLA